MKRNELKGKVAIITGASSGTGRATTFAFVREGVNTVSADLNREGLKSLEQEIKLLNDKALVVPTDVTKKEEIKFLIQETLKHFGRIDILVSNAGVYYRCPVRDLRVEDIGRVMEVNFYGCLYSILEVLPHMIENKRGHIVVVSSLEAKKGIPPDAVYTASKTAITGFTEVLRQEVREIGIHVSTIFPARVDTPMIANIIVPKIASKVPPERVAKSIVRAVLRKEAEVMVPHWVPKFSLLLNNISPKIGDWAVKVLKLSGVEQNKD